jgi:hypothetical protein
MALRETDYEGVDWIQVTQEQFQLQDNSEVTGIPSSS